MLYRLSLTLAIAGLSATVFAQRNDGNEVASSRLEQVTVIGKQATQGSNLGGLSLTELPLSAFVVSRDEIERIRFVDPDDFLDRIPGETQVRNLRIPNGGKPYTIPMVDGMPLDDPYNGATAHISRVNSFDIERIEIIKGPASALYGNNSFGGVINVVTREIPQKSEHRVWTEFGDFGHTRAGINSGGAITQSLGYFVDLNALKSDGLRDNYVAGNPNGFPDAVKNDRSAFSGKLSYQAPDNTLFSLRYEYLEREEVTATDIPQTSFDRDETLILSNRAGNPDVSFEDATSEALYLKAVHQLEAGEINFSTVLRVADIEGDGRFSDPKIENQKSVSAKLWYRHDFDHSNLIVGGENFSGEIEADFYGSSDLGFIDNVINQTETESRITALFAQYQFSPIQSLSVTLGLRQEGIHAQSLAGKADFDDLAPKFGATYKFDDNNTFWLGVSQGFLAPSPEDLFDPQEGNPQLKPEEAENIEFGLRGHWGQWRYSTAYYRTDITDYLFTQEVDTDNDGLLDAEQTSNAAQVTVQGLESVVEFWPADQWRFSLTHTYAQNTFDLFVQSVAGADDDFSGHSLSRSPKHHLNTRIAWLPLAGLIVELEGDFYSSYTTSDANDDPLGSFSRDERIDLRVNYATGSWTLWLNGLNLTDTLEDRVSYSARRGERSYRLVDGRSIQAGVSYVF